MKKVVLVAQYARLRKCPRCGRVVSTSWLRGELRFSHHALKPGGLVVESCPESNQVVTP